MSGQPGNTGIKVEISKDAGEIVCSEYVLLRHRLELPRRDRRDERRQTDQGGDPAQMRRSNHFLHAPQDGGTLSEPDSSLTAALTKRYAQSAFTMAMQMSMHAAITSRKVDRPERTRHVLRCESSKDVAGNRAAAADPKGAFRFPRRQYVPSEGPHLRGGKYAKDPDEYV